MTCLNYNTCIFSASCERMCGAHNRLYKLIFVSTCLVHYTVLFHWCLQCLEYSVLVLWLVSSNCLVQSKVFRSSFLRCKNNIAKFVSFYKVVTEAVYISFCGMTFKFCLNDDGTVFRSPALKFKGSGSF
jgi:hypothetical protein